MLKKIQHVYMLGDECTLINHQYNWDGASR
jgi:hypothetical protein